jgi:hypothetical protein
MRVRYDASRYPVPSVDGGGGDYLRDGQEYEVIEVGMDPARRTWLRVENEDGTPSLFDSRCFSHLDGTIPSAWRVALSDAGAVTFGPAAFLAPGFWEGYFDGVPEAVAAYVATTR